MLKEPDIPVRGKKDDSAKQKTLIFPVFCIGPHGLINFTPEVFLAKALQEESLHMPDPSLTVLMCDLLASGIHGFQEGHLGMWLVVIDLPSPR